MNEKEFLQKLNSKNNTDGMNTYFVVKELIEKPSNALEEQNALVEVQEKRNFLKRILEVFQKQEESKLNVEPEKPKQKSPKQIINDNIDVILDTIADSHYSNFVNDLAKDDDLIQIISNNLPKILDRFPSTDNGKFFKSELFRILTLREAGKELIKSNIDDILNHDQLNTVDALMLSGISEETDEKLNDFFEKNIDKFAKELLQDSIPYEREFEIEKYANSVSLILQELLRSEKAKCTDIKTLTRGGYSKVYQIGSKILKMGTPRKTYEMPNHPRILQPIARANLKGEDKLPFECIEVSDAVEELKITGEEEAETVYQIYKELREEGIIWTDAKGSNLGILKRNNTQEINGQPINVEPETLGFSGRIKEGVYNQGDIVILDTDYIYDANDPNIVWPDGYDSNKLERRWKSEKDALRRMKEMQAEKENAIKDDNEVR